MADRVGRLREGGLIYFSILLYIAFSVGQIFFNKVWQLIIITSLRRKASRTISDENVNINNEEPEDVQIILHTPKEDG